jgi:hypothetical protein
VVASCAVVVEPVELDDEADVGPVGVDGVVVALPFQDDVELRVGKGGGADEVVEAAFEFAARVDGPPVRDRGAERLGALPAPGATEHVLDRGQVEDLETLGAIERVAQVTYGEDAGEVEQRPSDRCDGDPVDDSEVDWIHHPGSMDGDPTVATACPRRRHLEMDRVATESL